MYILLLVKIYNRSKRVFIFHNDGNEHSVSIAKNSSYKDYSYYRY